MGRRFRRRRREGRRVRVWWRRRLF